MVRGGRRIWTPCWLCIQTKGKWGLKMSCTTHLGSMREEQHHAFLGPWDWYYLGIKLHVILQISFKNQVIAYVSNIFYEYGL